MHIWKIRVQRTFTILRAIFSSFKPKPKKLHDVVSALTKFSELKHDHMFGCIFDRQEFNFEQFHFRTVPQNLILIINLDAHLINKCASKILRHSKIFSPPLSTTLEKLHNEAKPYNRVSVLTNFLELKFDRRFILALGR